jgi:peptidyl-prolyl cis-trans isomerase B (cyclophilin B)
VSEDRSTAARRARIEALRTAERTKARRRKAGAVAAVVLALAVIGGGITWAVTGGGNSNSTGAFCGNIAPGSPNGKKWSSPPAQTIDTSASYTAVLKTSCGDVTLSLDAKNAPKTVNSFVFLAQQNYFNHTHCHRLTTTGLYVLQCGDPTATGSGGPGYTIPDEYLDDPAIQGGSYPAGTVAMANSGPNTNGSQFFLVYQDSRLPASYTPFGTISSGLDIIQHVARDGVGSGGTSDSDGPPKDRVTINSVPVTKS